MTLLKKEILLVFFVANMFTAYSQTQIPEITKKDSTIVSSWIVGLGFNAVDDSDDTFNRLFDINDAWNAVPYPSRVSIGKYFKSGLGIEAIAAYNRYKKGKTVDGLPLDKSKDYMSLDARLSYDLNKIIGETGWFDPYVGVGLGYTHANSNSRGTYNAVFGFRTWFSDKIGLDVNTSGKWTMDKDLTNHLQHVIGVVYRFNYKKDLTKKGKKKLALIEEIEKEKERINDSIAQVDKEREDAKMLAEKLEKEKEKARLEQLEREQQEAKEKERNSIQQEINGLENVYFAFDSSTLTRSSKTILSNLIAILNSHSNLVVEVGSHTDSRGSETYNYLLSERRLKSTMDYLLEAGVSSDKIIGKAYGEKNLLNECNDNTKCSESKHKENRRVEFKIVNF